MLLLGDDQTNRIPIINQLIISVSISLSISLSIYQSLSLSLSFYLAGKIHVHPFTKYRTNLRGGRPILT